MTAAAAVLSSRRAGLAFVRITIYAALLGYSADHYPLGLSGRSLGDRLVAFLGGDGLVVEIRAVVLGTLAWVVGRIAAKRVAIVRDRRRESSVDSR